MRPPQPQGGRCCHAQCKADSVRPGNKSGLTLWEGKTQSASYAGLKAGIFVEPAVIKHRGPEVQGNLVLDTVDVETNALI